MRIAFLSPSAQLGGAERCLVDLVASIRRAGPHLPMLVVAASEGPLLERLRAIGVETRVLPMDPALEAAGDSGFSGGGLLGPVGASIRLARAGTALARHAAALARLLRAWRPDVVHSNGMKHHLAAALARGGGAPVVWHVRDLVGPRRVTRRALALFASRAAGAIAVSRTVARDLASALPRLRTEVVYDAIDLDEFSPGPAEGARLDALAGLAPAPAAAVRVGIVAAYGRWKGQDVFLEAVARVAPRIGPEVARFYVVGGPIYRTAGSQLAEAELRERAHRLGILGWTGFVPFQADPAWLFRSLDVVVHASTQPEPFGRTIAEAMACGRALVASRLSGAAELVANGPALLVSPGDPAALADALAVLLADPARRATMAAAARDVAARHFSRDRLAGDLFRAYRRLGIAIPAGLAAG